MGIMDQPVVKGTDRPVFTKRKGWEKGLGKFKMHRRQGREFGGRFGMAIKE